MAKNVRVSVPNSHGDEIVVRFGGQAKQTFKVSDGHVSVDENNVDEFVSAVDGAKRIDDNKTVAKSDK